MNVPVIKSSLKAHRQETVCCNTAGTTYSFFAVVWPGKLPLAACLKTDHQLYSSSPCL